MIKTVIALSKDEFLGVLKGDRPDNRAYISILDADAGEIIPTGSTTLSQKFADWNAWSDICVSDKGAMTYTQAVEMVKFICALHSRNKEYNLIVHCSAGVCRSGAVAQFVHVVCQTDTKFFDKHNNHIIPNIWVLNLLASVYSTYKIA